MKHATKRMLGFKRTEYELVATGIKVAEVSLSSTSDTVIEYDRIGRDQGVFKRQEFKLLGLSIFFAVLSILMAVLVMGEGHVEHSAWAVWLVVSVSFYLWFSTTRREGIVFASDYGRLHIEGAPKQLDSFVAELSQRKAAYIEDRAKRRFETIDKLEAERYLLALEDGGVITPVQHKSLRSSVLQITESGPVGFGQYGDV